MFPAQEYCLVLDNDARTYVIRADERQVFEHWVLAMEGKRHMPANFNPQRVDFNRVIFQQWREE